MENALTQTEWSKESVLKLIELYRENYVLWDQTCAEFKERNAKNNAWTDISNAMKISKFEVQDKMRKTIGQFQREFKKLKSGAGADSVKSKWFAFDSLQFIKDKAAPRHTREAGLQNTNEEETEEEGDEVTEEITDMAQNSGQSNSAISPKSTAVPVTRKQTYSKRKRNPEAQEAYEVMKSLQAGIIKKDDCDVFGENVACQLRLITDMRSRMIAKHKRNQVLFEVGMAQFDNNTNPPSNSSSTLSSASLDPLIQCSSGASSVRQLTPTQASSISTFDDMLEDVGSEEPIYTVLK